MKQFNLFHNLSDGARRGSTLGVLSTLSRLFLGQLVFPARLPFSKPKVNWLLHDKVSTKSRSLFAKIAAVLCVLFTIGSGNAWGANVVSTMDLDDQSPEITTSTTSFTGTNQATWTLTKVANTQSVSSDGGDKYYQIGSGSATATSMTWTSSSFNGRKIKSVAVTCSSNSTATVTVTGTGGTFSSSPNTVSGSTKTTRTFTSSAAGGDVISGDLVVRLAFGSATKKNIRLFQITVTFDADQYTVTWKNNGSTATTTNVIDGFKPTFPSTPSSCDDVESTTFYGWTQTAWSGKIDDISGKTTDATKVYTAASAMPNVTAAVTYHAVFAKQTIGAETKVTGGTFSDAVTTQTGWTGTGVSSYSGNGVKFDDANDNILSPDISAGGYTYVRVKIKAGHNGGSGSVFTVASLDASGNVITSGTITPTDAYGSQSTVYTINLSGATVVKYVKVTMTSKTNNMGMKMCEVYNVPCTWSKYMTACSTDPTVMLLQAGQTHGTFTMTQSSTPVTSVTTTSAQAVTITATPDAGYYLSNLTASNPTTGTATVTGSGNTRTVTYSANADGTSTITATFSPIWYLKGSFNSWNESNPASSVSDGVASVSVDLSAMTKYEFQFYDKQNSAWYYNGGAILTDISGWTYTSGSGSNTRLYTGPAGTYTFKINLTTKAVQVIYPSVTHPSAGYAYFQKQGSWSGFKVYNYTDDGHRVSDWAGSPSVTNTTTICGTTYYYCALATEYDNVIFRDNGANQWKEIAVSGFSGKYCGDDYSATPQTWKTFATYTITFEGNGNTGGSMANVEGICPGSSETLAAYGYEKTGYDFTGWKTNVAVTANSTAVAADGIVPDEATISSISSNITLTAQWTKKTYTVTYNAGTTPLYGGAISGSHANDTKIYGTNLTLPGVTFTSAGYTQDGWTKSDLGATKTNNLSGSYTSNEPQAFYPHWVGNSFTITLDNQSATSAGTDEIAVTFGASTNLTATPAITVPTKTNYDFGGYYTEVDGGVQIIAANGNVNASASYEGDNFTDASKVWRYNDDVTLYASWTPTVYTITYNLNGGTQQVSPTPATSYTVESSAITLPTPTRTGYTFNGWYANSDLSTGGVQTTIAAGSTGNKKYWAKWTINNYTVNWVVNGTTWTGASHGSPSTNANYGTKVTTIPTAPTKSDCDDEKVFVGWTATEIGSTPTTAPADLFTTQAGSPAITGNTTFYAVFATASESSTKFKRMADLSELNSASKIAFINSYSSSRYILNTSLGAAATTPTESDGEISVSDGQYWTLEKSNSKWKFKTGDDYLVVTTIPTSGSKTGAIGKAASGNSEWVITGNTYTSNGTPVFTVYSAASSTAGLEYNKGWLVYYGTDFNTSWYTIRIYVPKTTYSDFVTSCGTCLPAPDPITVKVKSEQATLSWPAVSDATGYTVTCKQSGVNKGSITVDGTTATITGLTANNEYDYTVQSTGSVLVYDCFPTNGGTFRTSTCDDVPVISYATATADAITVGWTCENASATLRVYSDRACSSQVGYSTVTAKTTTVGSLEKNTKYYFKVITAADCPSMVDSITTEQTNINIVEWSTTSITFDFNEDIDATLFLEGRKTDKIEQSHYATGLFFSKYYEAGGDNKMLAIYNGTKEKINLTGWFIQSCSSGGRLMLNTYGRKETGYIYPQEEIILGVYDTKNSAEGCAEEVEGHENWYTADKGTPGNTAFDAALTFGGRTSVALYYTPSVGDTIMKDIIGSYFIPDAVNTSYNTLSCLGKIGESSSECSKGKDAGCVLVIDDTSWSDGTCYWTLNGDNIKTKAEESNYGLATNRCLLVRKNSVLCGDSAVKYNKVAKDTLTDNCRTMAQTFRTLATEWSGYRIGAGASSGEQLMDSTCTGFAYAGEFNYNTYYVKYDTIKNETALGDLRNEDGNYVIDGLQLDSLYCGDLRIDIKDKSTSEVYSSVFKVPMMVTENMTTKDTLFSDRGSTACETCDMVIMKNVTLTKATDGTTGDAPRVKDVKIYPGGKLIIPTGTNYTVNSLSLRREEDEVSSIQVVGNLTISNTNSVILDLRIDPSNWHLFSLPYDCDIDDIKFADGTAAVYGTDFLVRYYDGQYRAANKSGGWKDMPAHSTMEAGKGYVIGLMGTGNEKKELRFQMANSVIAAEKSGTKYVDDLYAWGGDKTDEQLTPNHKGWNLIGNPYLSYYSAGGIDSVLALGTLELDESTNPPHYVLNTTGAKNVRYVVVPNGATGKSGYKQVTVGANNLTPFTAYFVQVGGADPSQKRTIGFASSNAGRTTRAAVVRRREAEYQPEDNHPIWLGLELIAADGQKDNTTLLISDEFTDGYDMMDDLVKMRGTRYNNPSVTTAPILASRNNKEELAFNALPDESAAVNGVPLNYYAAQAGTYTFTLDGRYNLEEVKSAMLYDATTAKYYDLMSKDYSFSTDRGDNKTRFTLFVRVERKQSQITTGNDNILTDGQLSLVAVERTLVLSGLSSDADIYVYDMSGKLLTGERAKGDHGVWRTTVPTAGVYFVRVNSTAGQQTLRTIVK